MLLDGPALVEYRAMAREEAAAYRARGGAQRAQDSDDHIAIVAKDSRRKLRDARNKRKSLKRAALVVEEKVVDVLMCWVGGKVQYRSSLKQPPGCDEVNSATTLELAIARSARWRAMPGAPKPKGTRKDPEDEDLPERVYRYSCDRTKFYAVIPTKKGREKSKIVFVKNSATGGFLFDTAGEAEAALEHWEDEGAPRKGPLLYTPPPKRRGGKKRKRQFWLRK